MNEVCDKSHIIDRMLWNADSQKRHLNQIIFYFECILYNT